MISRQHHPVGSHVTAQTALLTQLCSCSVSFLMAALPAAQVPYDFVSSLDVTPAAAAGLVSATEDAVLLACSDRIDAFDTGAAGWA